MPDVHVLDEPQRVAGAVEVAGQLEDRALVQPALDHDVDLDGEPRSRRRVDSLEHAVDLEVDVVHCAKDLVVQRVEAHRYASEAGAGEIVRASRASSAPFVVSVRSTSPSAGQLLDQHRQVAPDERLAAGDADLLHAAAHEDACDALDLLERQQLVAAQELVVASEDLLRHAVDAPEVAAVGDGDAEIAQRTAECVGQGHTFRVPRPKREGARAGCYRPSYRKYLAARSGLTPMRGARGCTPWSVARGHV